MLVSFFLDNLKHSFHAFKNHALPGSGKVETLV